MAIDSGFGVMSFLLYIDIRYCLYFVELECFQPSAHILCILIFIVIHLVLLLLKCEHSRWL